MPNLKQRVGIGISIGIAIVCGAAGNALGFYALTHQGGAQTTEGEVVSITDIALGKAVCVKDDDSGRTRCGEVFREDLPDRLNSIEVGRCAYMKIRRGQLLALEPRQCTTR